MSQNEPLNRSRNFRVYEGLSDSPRVVIVEAPSVQPAPPPSKAAQKKEFKKIFFAVVLLLGLYSMTQYDPGLNPSFRKKSPAFVTKGSDDYERPEPGFIAKVFCRGNQRPRFCD